MTTMTPVKNIWSSMPGWGIVADLMPPEVIAARRLIAILALLVLGYAYATMQKHSATKALARENSRTSALLAQQNSFSNVTQLRGSITSVQQELTSLMGADVDFAATVNSIRSALPASMALSDVEIKISPVAAGAAQAAATGSLNTSTHQVVGSVTLTGSGAHLADLATYITNLKSITGVTDIVPASNQLAGSAAQFNVCLSLTDQVFTHHYDAAKAGH
jgi:hypothetical protein